MVRAIDGETVRVVSSKEAAALRKERIAETFQLDPLTTINLKGKIYTMELNNFAVKGILKDTGYNLLSAGFGIKEVQDPEILGALLYWSLIEHQPDLTQEAVDKLFGYRHYAYVLECLKVALDLFLPDMSDVQIEGVREKQEVREGEDPL
jgi:hypothetical protein